MRGLRDGPTVWRLAAVVLLLRGCDVVCGLFY